jgi:predicted nucleotidyltransferase
VIDFATLLRTLSGAGVRFIIVGGAAATAHGSARLTQDLDIVYERSRENLERLVQALTPHQPYLRGAPPGLPFKLDLETLRRGLNFTLTRKFGDIDLFGVRCLCLGLDKLIDVKRAAGRPKDLEVVAELVAIRQARG